MRKIMDKHYADTVRLLLAIAPDVFANDISNVARCRSATPDWR